MTKEAPLAVAIAALIKDNRILLIKRERGDYIGYWGMPGGKIYKDEHIREACVREIEEESGIRSKFSNYLGSVSEHLVEDGKIKVHLLLHILRLDAESDEITRNDGGVLKWFDLDDFESIKDILIPSDYRMIKDMVLDSKSPYYDCIIEKIGDKHFLRKFE